MKLEDLVLRIGTLTHQPIAIARYLGPMTSPVIVWCNEAMSTLTGYAMAELVGQPSSILHRRDAGGGLAPEHLALFLKGEEATAEVVNWRRDGTPIVVEHRLLPVLSEDGALAYLIGFRHDVTERVRWRQALEEEAARLREERARLEAESARFEHLSMVATHIDDGVIFTDRLGRIEWANRAFLARANLTLEEIVGRMPAEVKRAATIAPGERRRIAVAMQTGRTVRMEQTFLRATGEPYWVDLSIQPIMGRDGAFAGAIAVGRDITAFKEQQRKLEEYTARLEQVNLEIAEQHAALELSQEVARHNALHDALTGLANRRYLDDRLRDCLADPDHAVALFHIDLDRFKQINDTLGHAAGDAVLVAVAGRLRETVRVSDFVARIGGDEFVVLCPRATGREDLAALADRLIQRLREPVPFENHLCRFGGSIGIAVREAGDRAGGDLLVNADVALYRAKNLGRNRWEFYSDRLHAEMIARKRLSDEIVAGIDHHSFVPFYQPQVCLATGRLLGAEALARWCRADGRISAPPEFLDVAEDLALVGRLDRMILDHTLADMRRWRAQGLAIPRVSVNVSARRLHDPLLVEDVRALDIPRGWIAFELLESIYLDQPGGQLLWTLDALRDLGIPIELDDFGTGYSSIISLVRLRPHSIKIDKELVAPIAESAEAFALVCALVSIGATLGVQVMAEGVETAAHLHRLRQSGCQSAQGHFFGPPMPAPAFEALLRRTGGVLPLGDAAAVGLAS